MEKTAPSDGDCRKIEDRPGDSDIKEGSSKLQETLSPRDREVDSPQVEFPKRPEKWYQKPATATWSSISALILVPILGVVVTIIAMRTAQNSSSAELQFEQKARLTTIIQQLSEIRGKIAELQLQYEDKAPIPSVTLRQALIKEAIELHGAIHVDSFQKMVIAESLNETNQPDQAEHMAKDAEREAKSLLERVLSAQVLAVAYFNQGKFEDGRRAYSRALDAAGVTDTADLTNTPGVDILIRAIYGLDTEQLWISSELRIGNCPGAKKQLQKLEDYGRLFPRVLADEAERRVQPTRTIVAKICP